MMSTDNLNRFTHRRVINGMNFNRSTDFGQHGECQFTTEVLAKFFQSVEKILFGKSGIENGQAEVAQRTQSGLHN